MNKIIIVLFSVLLSSQSWAICCKDGKTNHAPKAACGVVNHEYSWVGGNACPVPLKPAGGVCCDKNHQIKGPVGAEMNPGKCRDMAGKYARFYPTPKTTCN